VPLKSSFDGCQVDPCFTRRASTHPPPWNESSQKNLGAGTTNQRVSQSEAPQEKKKDITKTRVQEKRNGQQNQIKEKSIGKTASLRHLS
jgi:hypothetical protein